MSSAQLKELATHAGGMFMVMWLVGRISIDIPGSSVPITPQSLVVIIMPLLFGFPTILGLILWFVAGLLGLPVFSGGAGGVSILASNSGGFVLGFIVIATVSAWIRNWAKQRPLINGLTAFIGMHLLLMIIGLTWIWVGSFSVIAMETHILPYLPGLLIKSVIGSIIIYAVNRINPSWIG